ncbi:MAG TPA: GNAT family N-acetyltransferase [Anaerolineales bacterium]|nr:GNAT family N-acetyltransferase [Anaerolineales bacterium]
MELRPVTEHNWNALIKLKVSDDQSHFVASNLYSIAEAQFGFEDEGHWNFYPFGAYVGDEPVGFLMYSLNPNHSRFQAFITRLMVDQRFQGKGYGREIVQLVVKSFREDEQIKNIGISYEPENAAARNLYASLGFTEPGEMMEGEVLAVLKLR